MQPCGFNASMAKWGLAVESMCECQKEEQTAEHVINRCPIYQAPCGTMELQNLDEETCDWLLHRCPDI